MIRTIHNKLLLIKWAKESSKLNIALASVHISSISFWLVKCWKSVRISQCWQWQSKVSEERKKINFNSQTRTNTQNKHNTTHNQHRSIHLNKFNWNLKRRANSIRVHDTDYSEWTANGFHYIQSEYSDERVKKTWVFFLLVVSMLKF